MKGVVLEIRDGVAAVLREDGVVVKSLQHCSVGDTVEVPGDHVIRLRTYRRAAIAAAAAVLLLTGTVYGYNNIIPVSQVTVETGGAELSYTLNRKGRVLRMEAVNEEAREIVERLNVGRNGSIIEKRITLTEALEQTIAQTMPPDQDAASDQVTVPEFRITDVRSDSEARRKALLEEAEEAVLRNTPTAPDTSVPAPEGQPEPDVQPGPAEDSGSFTHEQPPHEERSFEARTEEAHPDTDRPDSPHTDGSQPDELLNQSRPEDAKPDAQPDGAALESGETPGSKDTPESGETLESKDTLESGAAPEFREISESGATPEAAEQKHEPGPGQQAFDPEQPDEEGKINKNQDFPDNSVNNVGTSGYVDDPGSGDDPGHVDDPGSGGDPGHGGSGHDGDSGHGAGETEDRDPASH